MDIMNNDPIVTTEDDANRVIMSEGLSLDLGTPEFVEQILMIGETRYICTLRTAEFKDSLWTFNLEVPGMSLVDLLHERETIFLYEKERFRADKSFQFSNLDMTSPMITFSAKRIVSNDE